MSCGTSCVVSCNVFCICFSSNLKLRRGLCSLALALLPSQSSLNQSDGIMEGCGTSNLQHVHPFEVLVQSLLGVGLTILILLKSVVSQSCVLYHSIFIGLKWFLWLDHLVLTFPKVCLHLGWAGAEK